MNKKIKTEIAFGIILIAVMVFGGVFWLNNKNIQSEEQILSLTKSDNIKQQTRKDQITEKYFYINELGVKFKVPEDLEKELLYSYKKGLNGEELVGFSLKSLGNLRTCSSESGALGFLSKYTGRASETMSPRGQYFDQDSVLQFENFFVFFTRPHDVCSHEKIEIPLRNSLITATKNIELIK